MMYLVCPIGWMIFWFLLVQPAMHREKKYHHRQKNKYCNQGSRSWKLLRRNKTTWLDTRDGHHYTWINPKPCTRYLQQFCGARRHFKLLRKSRTKPTINVFRQMKDMLVGTASEMYGIHRDLWHLITSIACGVCERSLHMLVEFVDVCTEGSKPPDVKESAPSTLRRRPTLNLAFQFMGNNRALAGQWVPQRIFRRALRLEVKLIRKFRKFRLLKQTLKAFRDTTREDREKNGELHKKAKKSARGEVARDEFGTGTTTTGSPTSDAPKYTSAGTEQSNVPAELSGSAGTALGTAPAEVRYASTVSAEARDDADDQGWQLVGRNGKAARRIRTVAPGPPDDTAQGGTGDESSDDEASDSDDEVCPHCCNCSLLRECICRSPRTAPAATSLDAAAGTAPEEEDVVSKAEPDTAPAATSVDVAAGTGHAGLV